MEAVRLWCAHELAGRDSDADHTFRSVFAEVGRPELPAGFTRRVVAHLALEPEQRRRVPRRFASIAAGVAAAVLSVALVVFGAVSLAPLLGAQLVDLMNFSARGFVWFVQALDTGVGMWTILGRVGRAIGGTITQPSVTLTFVGFEFMGIVALYGLHRILKFEKG
ncbi:MAG: hypothetical protein V3T48_01340 [Vicinamibacterales bacterium]